MKLFVKKEKKQKDPLLQTYFVSLLSLVLCVAMFMGTTFAWFTSDVSSPDNQIFVGTLSVGVKQHDGNGWVEISKTAVLDENGKNANLVIPADLRWEPGYTFVKWMKVENSGELAANYRLMILCQDGSIDALGKYFDVYAYVGDGSYEEYAKVDDTTYKSFAEAKPGAFEKLAADTANWAFVDTLDKVAKGKPVGSGKLLPRLQDSDSVPSGQVAFAIHMKEDAPAVDGTLNIMGATISGITVKVEAWQAAGDEDSLGTTHDNFVTNEEELRAAFAEGGKAILLDDIVLTEGLTVAAAKEVYLNLNGHTVSQSKECTASYEMIRNNGTLTIADSSAQKTGKLSFTDTGAGDPNFGWGTYTINNNGHLVVEGGTVELIRTQADKAHCSLALFQYSGTTVINDGNFINEAYRSVRLWHGSMTINNGAFKGQVWVHCVGDNASLTINGGSFAPAGGDKSSVFINNVAFNDPTLIYQVAVAIKGGNFATKIGASKPENLAGCITGGTFTEDAKTKTEAVLFSADFK